LTYSSPLNAPAIAVATSGRHRLGPKLSSTNVAPGLPSAETPPARRDAARRPEEDFQFGKECFGLDQCQARLYTAILRHIVLVMAALAICAITAALLRTRAGTQAPPPAGPGQAPPADPGLIPLTVPEIRRITTALTAGPCPNRSSFTGTHGPGVTRHEHAGSVSAHA
jgi:hypothetical protein